MVSPDSDLGILLKAMGEYQHQHHVETGDHQAPALVSRDWVFHERQTGFGREEICRLLPQLVSRGLADGLGQGKGMPFGYRVSDGYASISAQGQRQLAEWAHPLPPGRSEIAGFSPEAQARLHTLLVQASALGITSEDLAQVETLLCDIAEDTTPDRAETTSRLVQHLQGNAELTVFFAAYVLPFMRSVVGT